MKALFLILIFISNFSISQTSYSQIGHDSINTKLLNELVIDQINYERFTRGIQKLSLYKEVSDAAVKHNNWMIKFNKFEHSHNGLGEICALTQCNSNMSYFELAKDIVKGWMGSPRHRALILDTQFTYIGTSVNFYIKEQSKFLSIGIFNYYINATTCFK